MFRAVVMATLLFVNFILQSTVFGFIEIINVKPNTSVVFIICYAMLRGDMEGAVFGFFSGLIHDIYFGRLFGLYALLGMLTGFICGKPFKDFYRENYLLPLFLSAVTLLIYGFCFYFTNFLFRGKTDFFYYFGRIILPETVYSSVISIVIYRITYSVNNRLEQREKMSRRLF